jgi:hypothetical protein
LDLLGGCFNGESINDWEFNGPGSNPIPVQPVEVDFFKSAYPLILTAETLALFEECPDLVVPCEDYTRVIYVETPLVLVGGIWGDIVVPADTGAYMIDSEPSTVVVGDDWGSIVIPSRSNTVTP